MMYVLYNIGQMVFTSQDELIDKKTALILPDRYGISTWQLSKLDSFNMLESGELLTSYSLRAHTTSICLHATTRLHRLNTDMAAFYSSIF